MVGFLRIDMAEDVTTRDPIAQEDVTVPGHSYDVLDEELPQRVGEHKVLVDSDMSADPVEGVQGSYTLYFERRECPECGTEGVYRSVQTLPGIAFDSCAVCDWSKEE